MSAEPVASLDRRLGHAIRRSAARAPTLERALRRASQVMAPTFVGTVAVMTFRRSTRRAGLEGAVAAVVAATAARLARDAVGRPRPGHRTEGGLPSRHAAAATAIARAAARHHPGLAATVTVAGIVGLAGRVVDAQHDPGDIVAGTALGWSVDLLVAAVGRSVP